MKGGGNIRSALTACRYIQGDKLLGGGSVLATSRPMGASLVYPYSVNH